MMIKEQLEVYRTLNNIGDLSACTLYVISHRIDELLDHIDARERQYAELVAAGNRMRERLGKEMGHPRDARAANEYYPTCSMCQWDDALAALSPVSPPAGEEG